MIVRPCLGVTAKTPVAEEGFGSMVGVRIVADYARAATMAAAMLAFAAPMVEEVEAADEESGVGIVAEYRPAAARFSFARSPRGETVPVMIGMVVMPGDRITLPAGATMVVQLANGQTRELNGPETHTIPDWGPLGRLKTAVFSAISGVFDDEFRHEGLAGSRGGEQCAAEGDVVPAIEVPILVPGARIVAGTRDLPLAWRGGCAPFVVTVLAGGQTLVHRESIEGRQIRLDDVPLVPGRYSVVITDTDGRRFEGALEATGEGPALPAELAADTNSLGVVAQAVWLAEHERGRWRLESFERLRPLIRSGDPLAGSIGDGVLWGASPR
jgi:hypothetical protein